MSRAPGHLLANASPVSPSHAAPAPRPQSPTPHFAAACGTVRAGAVVSFSVATGIGLYLVAVTTWARDLWRLCHRVIRQAFSHTVAAWLKAQLGRPLLHVPAFLTA